MYILLQQKVDRFQDDHVPLRPLMVPAVKDIAFRFEYGSTMRPKCRVNGEQLRSLSILLITHYIQTTNDENFHIYSTNVEIIIHARLE